MHGLFPQSEEFMFLDPEQIEEYGEWQCFSVFLEKDVNQSNIITSELKYKKPQQCATCEQLK